MRASPGRRAWAASAATPMQSVIFNQEEGKADVAGGGPFAIGLGMCIPTLMAYCGKDVQGALRKARACRAKRSGASCSPNRPAAPTSRACAPAPNATATTWTINGSKIWTTGAQFSDYGSCSPAPIRSAQAQGADDVLSLDEDPGRRGPADQAGERRQRLQRGVLHRRQASRIRSASAKWARAGRWRSPP